jgi:2-polyprenyl-3-methyl-5-hydroxy-6-metoxy-1,4-benzoquinol methylase
MRCLEVGCGGGDVTRELARRADPNGRALGIDIDAAALAIAREEAGRDCALGVEYQEGDVLTAELEADYDVIYVRFLLTHMADPAAAAARIAVGLRPGGVLIVEDQHLRVTAETAFRSGTEIAHRNHQRTRSARRCPCHPR